MHDRFNFEGDRQRRMMQDGISNSLNRPAGNRSLDNPANSNNNGTSSPVRKFDKEKFDLGTNYFRMGGKLENASLDMKNNQDFINGYTRAERLKIISNMKSGRGL